MTDSIKVLHIITGLSDGGAEAVLYRLVTHEHPGIDHTVVSLTEGGKYGPMLEAKGVSVSNLKMPKGRVTLRSLRQLWKILRHERPHIVQTWMFHANLIGGIFAKLVGVKRIYWGIHHTSLIPGTTGNSTRIVDWACARLSRTIPTGIIACGKKAREVHVSKGYEGRKFTVIPNGYDVSYFCPDPRARERVRQELGIPREAGVLGMIGRWDPQKDHANLVEALRIARTRYPDLHLALVGSGCDVGNSELRKLLDAAALHDNVHLLGRRMDVPAVMNALDLHILSSNNEAFPNVVSEAMACGVPCVVTDVGDAKEIVGSTGWVVPPKEAQALSEAIVDAVNKLKEHSTWALRKKSARDRIGDMYSLEIMVSRYHDVWKA